jgi:Flp pilus assembly protein TadD/SAM-dependent methyltransferase
MSEAEARAGRLLAAAADHLGAGRLDEAERLARESLAAAPAAGPWHLLGIVAAQRGELQTAADALGRAVALDPGAAEAHDSLGNVLVALGRRDEAVASYRRALTAAPGYAEAHHNLALTLCEGGDAAGAANHLRQALAARPDYADAHVTLAALLVEQGDRDGALGHLRRAAALAPGSARAANDLGRVLVLAGKLDEAVTALERAVALAPADPLLRGNLAIALVARGQRAQAADVLFECWRALPAGSGARAALLPHAFELLRDLARMPLDRTWREIGLGILASDELSPDSISVPLARGLRALPGIAAALAGAGADRDVLDEADVQALTADPLFVQTLAGTLLRDPEVERALVHLRRCLLRRVSRGEAPGVPAAFSCALALQSFASEYAFFVADDEEAQAAALKARVERALAEPARPAAALQADLMVAALYAPLGALDGIERLPAPEGPFAMVHRQQVLEPARERTLRAGLPALTPIQDQTSVAVRAMYEQNPYPRWSRAPRPSPTTVAGLVARLRPGEPAPDLPEPMPVLVAGCGTGQHAALVTRELPGCDVLAVDLSATSLGYAARRLDELGLPVRLAQADLLQLGGLGRTFAVIECSGVLHHLADPLAGWRVLVGLLHPRGVMKVGLYSTVARRFLAPARALLAERGFPATPDGIRAARRAILDLPEGHPARAVVLASDFYGASPFRDLLMHVQEHTFTIPQLASSLETLDLRFLGFQLARAVLAQFQSAFPGRAPSDLAAWEEFEATHPATFGNMYQFWCCPR